MYEVNHMSDAVQMKIREQLRIGSKSMQKHGSNQLNSIYTLQG